MLVATTARILGHATPQVTAVVYAHVLPRATAQAVERLEAAFRDGAGAAARGWSGAPRRDVGGVRVPLGESLGESAAARPAGAAGATPDPVMGVSRQGVEP